MIVTPSEDSKKDSRSRFLQDLLLFNCSLAFLKTIGEPNKIFRASWDLLDPMCISGRQ